jgi:hypothetical protein
LISKKFHAETWVVLVKTEESVSEECGLVVSEDGLTRVRDEEKMVEKMTVRIHSRWDRTAERWATSFLWTRCSEEILTLIFQKSDVVVLDGGGELTDGVVTGSPGKESIDVIWILLNDISQISDRHFMVTDFRVSHTYGGAWEGAVESTNLPLL